MPSLVTVSEVVFRPMRPGDVPGAEALTARAFLGVDLALARRTDPEPSPRSPGRSAAWRARAEHLLATDPGGCWVAERGGAELVGVAVSLVRDKTWILASYAVRPDLQGAGIGTALLAAAGDHGRACLRAMLSASEDPRAVRRYRRAGFTLHPQMLLSGTVDRGAIPTDVGRRVREGGPGDRDLLDSVDRRVRDAAHGPDHAMLEHTSRLLVAESAGDAGYAWVGPDGDVEILAATGRRTATQLLWAAVADGPAEQTIGHVTAANHWAVDVGLEARLGLRTGGYLALRGMRPPAPYLHHGSLL